MLSDSFSHDIQNSEYDDVLSIFRKNSSKRPSSLASDDTASTDTTTEAPWSDVFARPFRAEETSVYDNLRVSRID